jgi:transcriptional regulator with XRE-family HTH domain
MGIMSDSPAPEVPELANKIARLVEERGWNQEDFARIAGLNRQTVRQILLQGSRRLRNVTISRCARALGLTVNELRTLPLEQLLPRMNGQYPADADQRLQKLFEKATQPELFAWLERNPDRARHLNDAELDELLSLQGTGGPLTTFGVEHFVEQIERRRRLLDQVQAIAGTEYVDLLEKLVGLLFETVQPCGDRN